MQRIGGRLGSILFIALLLALIGTGVGLTGAALGLSATHAAVFGAVGAVVLPWTYLALSVGAAVLISLVGRVRRGGSRGSSTPPLDVSLQGRGQWVLDPAAWRLVGEHGPPASHVRGKLRCVVGIGTTLEVDDWALEILSLESYEESFTLLLRLHARLPPLPPSKTRHLEMPPVSAAAHVDRGGEYELHRSSRMTGRRHDAWHEQDMALNGTPALDPAARELRVVISELRWILAGEVGVYWSASAPLPADGWNVQIQLPEAQPV